MAEMGRLAEIDGGPLTIMTSIFLHIEYGLSTNPHGPAVLCMHQAANHLSELVPADDEFRRPQHDGVYHVDCLILTYTQLHHTALVLAAGMIENGVRPGSTIVTLIPNGGEYSLLLWTCTIMKLTLVSLDSSRLNASNRTELQESMETLKPAIVAVQDVADAQAVDNLIEDLGLRKPLYISLLGGDKSKGWKSLLDLAADATKSPADVHTLLEEARNDIPDRVHSILFTSGTSAGRPKGCPQRVASVSYILQSQSWLINVGNCARVLLQAHNSRAIVPALALQTWSVGGTVVLPGTSFTTECTLDAVVRVGVTFIVLLPAMVHALALDLASHPRNLDAVRTVMLGGDMITKDVLMRCTALFPNAKVCINHGMTEGGGFFTWPFFDTPISQIPYFAEISPIGAVAPGTQVRIWEVECARVTRRREPGELHVCCESIVQHYLGNAGDETSFYEDEKGRWFRTGDLAMVDDEGLVFILGRCKDVIKRANVSIIPAALESCIEKYTAAQVSTKRAPHPLLLLPPPFKRSERPRLNRTIC